MEANAGFVIGIIILTLIPYSVHPSILPASRSSFGRLCMYCLKKKIVDAPHSPGRITPALVLMIPRDVHGQTVCDEVAYQQCQNYCNQCQDQTVFIPHKIFSGILISGKQVFVVIQMHLGKIKIQGHTFHNHFTAFLEGSEETCKKRKCDRRTYRQAEAKYG